MPPPAWAYVCVCISFMQCSLCFFCSIEASELKKKKKHALCIFFAFKTTHRILILQFVVVLYIRFAAVVLDVVGLHYLWKE